MDFRKTSANTEMALDPNQQNVKLVSTAEQLVPSVSMTVTGLNIWIVGFEFRPFYQHHRINPTFFSKTLTTEHLTLQIFLSSFKDGKVLLISISLN